MQLDRTAPSAPPRAVRHGIVDWSMFNPLGPFFYLLLYLAALYIRPHEYVPALRDLPVLPVLLVLAFALWLLRVRKRFEAPQHGMMLGLLLGLMASVAFSGWIGGAVKVFNDFAPVMLLFYMLATSVDSPRRLRQVFLVIVAAMAAIAVHGIEQAANGVSWTGVAPIQGRITYLGFLNDPNDLGMALVMAMPMAFHVASTASSWLLRLASWSAAGAICFAIYLTNSRGTVVALAAMLLVAGLRHLGLWKSLLLGPLLLAPVIALAPSRMEAIDDDSGSAEGRVEAWYEGLLMFKQSPLFGVGKGQFVDHHSLTAHNSYVLSFAELGLVGYFFWLSLLLLSALMLWWLVRAQAPQDSGQAGSASIEWREYQRGAWTLAYSLTGVLVAILFLSRSYVVILYLLLALVVAVHQMTTARWPALRPALLPWSRSRMLGVFVAVELGSIAFFAVLTRVLLAVMT